MTSMMRSGLTEMETKAFDRLDAITVGCMTTIRGVVVTRWSIDAFELESCGRYTERHDEAAINICNLIVSV